MHGGGGGGGGGGTVRVGTVPLQALPTSGANRFIILTKPCILLKPAPVSQQVQALQPKLPNNNNNITTTNNNNNNKKKEAPSDSKPELLRCKRRSDLPSKLGLPKQLPASVARRNARERNRVKQVNLGFDTLRDHVPSGRKNKKLSKVDTLRSAVEYIKYLMGILTEDGGKPMPSLPPRDVSFASGESPDASSPLEDDQGFSDDGETAMLAEDSDTGTGGGVDENRCFPSPSLGDNVAPFSKDASEDVHHQENVDVENRKPFLDSRHPPLGVSHLKQLAAAEEAGSFVEDEMCQVSDSVFQEYSGVPTKQEAFQDYSGLSAEQEVFQDYSALPAKQEVFQEYGGMPVKHDIFQDLHPPAKQAFQELLGVPDKRDIFQEYSGLPVKQEVTDLAGLDAADLAQIVSLRHPPPAVSLSDSGLSSPVLTPLQNASLFLLSPPAKSFHSLNPLPRKSLSDAETNSSMLSPTSSVAASDHSSVAVSEREALSAAEQIRNISTWLHDSYPDSSALTTGDDIFQIAAEGR